MRCPKCKSDALKVIDTRHVCGESIIRRRRTCLLCGSKFTSYESNDEAVNRLIAKIAKGARPL